MKAIERLYKYLEHRGIKPTVFERKSGISSGYLSKQFNRKADIGESILITITENCPDINPVWLLLGQGNMFIDSQSTTSLPVNEISLYNIYKEKDDEVKLLLKENGRLEERLRHQEGKILGLQSQIAKFDSDNEAARDVGVAAVG